MIKCIEPLTPREQEVYNLLVECKSTKEISRQLFIAPTTVKTNIDAILRKTLTHSQKEVIYKHYKTILEGRK